MRTYYDPKTRQVVTVDYRWDDARDQTAECETSRRPATEREIVQAELDSAAARHDHALSYLSGNKPSAPLRKLARFAETAAEMTDQATWQPGLMAEIRLALARLFDAADAELVERHDKLIEEGDAKRAYDTALERLRALDTEPAAVEVAL